VIKAKIFIDTNVWFSFFYGSENSAKIVSKFMEGKIDVFISKNVLDELIKNALQKIPKIQRELLTFFETYPPGVVNSPVKIDRDVENYVDFKDRHIFQACVNANCDIFVTGNLKDFDVESIYKKYKIRVLSPKQVVERVLDTLPK